MPTVVYLPHPTSVTQCHLSEIFFLGSHGPSLRATLPSQLFHEAAYQADDRQDLLGAISEFLDGSIVIPPSEVEGRDLLRSVAAFQRELLRKRREREQTKVEMTTRGGYVAPGKGQTPSPVFCVLTHPCSQCWGMQPGLPDGRKWPVFHWYLAPLPRTVFGDGGLRGNL